MRSLRSTTSLNTSDTRPATPGHSSGRRTAVSPRFNAFSAPRMIVISSIETTERSTTCMVYLPTHNVATHRMIRRMLRHLFSPDVDRRYARFGREAQSMSSGIDENKAIQYVPQCGFGDWNAD